LGWLHVTCQSITRRFRQIFDGFDQFAVIGTARPGAPAAMDGRSRTRPSRGGTAR
jgi:hypothetical protein